MAPNVDDNSGPTLYLSPLKQYYIENESSEEEDTDELIEEELISNASRIVVPLEHNLRGLLMKVTGTEDLERVTQVKLRVIARDVPLQHLSVHIPALRELILDGSVVSTLRDLGCGLKNLKILKVNRCGLVYLDGMFAFEGLEELHAADNSIENPTPCVFLPNIRVIDLRRNRLKNVLHSLGFLSLCEKLEHIYLEGNDEISQFPKYRQTVKTLLPALRSLDAISFTKEELQGQIPEVAAQEFQNFLAEKKEHKTADSGQQKQGLATIIHGTESPRTRPSGNCQQGTGFTVRFPPKVFLDRSGTNQNKK